jgi:hypothetical protein
MHEKSLLNSEANEISGTSVQKIKTRERKRDYACMRASLDHASDRYIGLYCMQNAHAFVRRPAGSQ